MERGGGGSSSGGGGSGLGEDNRCACGRTLQMVGVHVTPTTGGQFELRVASTDSIEFLRRLVSKRLRVPKERICLLYRDRCVVLAAVSAVGAKTAAVAVVWAAGLFLSGWPGRAGLGSRISSNLLSPSLLIVLLKADGK